MRAYVFRFAPESGNRAMPSHEASSVEQRSQALKARWSKLTADRWITRARRPALPARVPFMAYGMHELAFRQDSQKRNQHLSNAIRGARSRFSKVDPMSAAYPLSVRRRIERRWAERVKSLRQIHRQIAVATERTLRLVFNGNDSPIPVPVRAVVDRRRLDRSPRD